MSVWRFLSLIGSLTGARLAGAALGFAIQLVLARTLIPEAVGTVMLGMSLGSLISLVVTGGYPALGVTYLARYHSLGRSRLARAFFAVALRDTLTLILAAYAVLIVVLIALPLETYVREALLFGALGALPHALVRLNNVSANSLRRFSLSFVPDFTVRPALLLGAIGLLALSVGSFAAWHVLTAFVVVNLGVALVQERLLRPHSAFCGFGAAAPPDLPGILRRRAVPLALVAIVSIAYSDVVTMLAGLFLPPADVAVVGVTIRVAALAGFVSQALQHFVVRDLTSAMTRGAADEARAILLQTNLTSIGLMLAAIAGAVVLGDLALSIFGESYRAGHYALVLFLVSQLMRAAGGMNMHLLSLDGLQARTAVTCVLSLAVLALLAWLTVSRFGVMGLAASVAAADAVWAVALGVVARRMQGLKGDIVAVLRSAPRRA